MDTEMQNTQPVAVSELGRLEDGRPVQLYRISGPDGTWAELSDLGARVTRLAVKDRNGIPGNVLQDFSSLELWRSVGKNHGATCGRFANRLAGAAFNLDGQEFSITANERSNTLHGGAEGFNLKLWQGTILDSSTVSFVYVSQDGEEGFPGQVTAEVRYSFDGSRLTITESGVTSRPTPFGLCNHAYFQISGPSPEANVLDQKLQIEADYMTPVNSELLPTGEIRPVAGTPFDFSQIKRIGEEIAADDEQIGFGGGYDHNFVLRKTARGSLELAATLYDPASGRTMRCLTTKPGLQVYTANVPLVTADSGEVLYAKHGAICLETQGFPNSMQRTHFPSPVLRPGELHREETVYEFSAD